MDCREVERGMNCRDVGREMDEWIAVEREMDEWIAD